MKFGDEFVLEFGDKFGESPNLGTNMSPNLGTNLGNPQIWDKFVPKSVLKKLGNIYVFLLATRILPASPNFGQAKHGQNDPAATVCQQGICCPICGHYFTHWTHPDISLRCRAGGRRLKNFRFSRNSIAARDFFLPACCGLNFDATDLPNSSFEPLYPKLFRGNPEVDLVSTVWPPDLPKVR